jgi:hypothetical protein
MSVIFKESDENPYIDKNRKNRVNKYFDEFIFYVLKNYFKQKKRVELKSTWFHIMGVIKQLLKFIFQANFIV